MWQIGVDPIVRALQTLRLDLALLQIPREEWAIILIGFSAQRSRRWPTRAHQFHWLLQPSQAQQAFKKAFCVERRKPQFTL